MRQILKLEEVRSTGSGVVTRSSTASACAVVLREWNDCIRLFFPHWTAAQAKAVLLRGLLLREIIRF